MWKNRILLYALIPESYFMNRTDNVHSSRGKCSSLSNADKISVVKSLLEFIFINVVYLDCTSKSCKNRIYNEPSFKHNHFCALVLALSSLC